MDSILPQREHTPGPTDGLLGGGHDLYWAALPVVEMGGESPSLRVVDHFPHEVVVAFLQRNSWFFNRLPVELDDV